MYLDMYAARAQLPPLAAKYMVWKRSPTSRIGMANFGIAALRASSCVWVSASAAIADPAASASNAPAKAAPIVFLNIHTPLKKWDLPNAVVLDGPLSAGSQSGGEVGVNKGVSAMCVPAAKVQSV